MKTKLIALSLFSQFLFAQTTHIPQNKYQFIDQTIIDELYKKKDYNALIAEYSKTPFLSPDYMDHQMNIISLYTNSDRFKEALELCESLSKNKYLEPNYQIMMSYASLLSDDGKYEQALEQFDRVKKIIPNSPVLNYNYALIYYRQGNIQKAIDMLKHNLTYYPYHNNSIYMLGKIALDDNNLAVGTSLFMTYLLSEPQGRSSEFIISALDKKLSSFNTGTSKYVYSSEGDDLSELDMILKNDFALNPQYKVRMDLDEKFTRNLQIIFDYYKDHEFKNGFIENNFGKWISYVAKQDKVSEITYYSLLSTLDSNPKIIGKNIKKIEDFVKTDDFTSIFNVYGTKTFDQKKTLVTINKGLYQYSVFTNDFLDFDNFNARILYANGNVRREFSYKNGEKVGLVKEYTELGTLNFEAIFNNNTNFDFKSYHPITKKIESSGTLNDDVIQKTKTSYDIFGNKTLVENYKDGKYDGLTNIYYVDGSLKLKREYKDGEYNGAYEFFSENKLSLIKGSFLKDNPNGEVVYKFVNGDLKAIERGSNGLLEYSETKNVLGNIVDRNFYQKGVLSKNQTYYYNGQLKSLNEFDKNGKLAVSKYYDIEGNLYFEDHFKNNELINSIQYSKNNLKGTKVQIKGDYEYKNFDDQLIYTVPYSKGKQNGIKKTYNKNGILTAESTYVDDVLSGQVKKYYDSGDLYSVSNYVNGQKQGLHFEYDSKGNLVLESHYVDGKLNGMMTIYYDGTKIKQYAYYQNDERIGKAIFLNLNGEIERISYYANDVLYKQENYINGVLIDTDDRLNRTGTYSVKRSEAEIITVSTINGQRHGKFLTTLSDGTVTEDMYYLNTKLHGESKNFTPVGKLESSFNYVAGNLEGESLEYDVTGLLNTKTIFKNNVQVGLLTKYYPNGKVYSTAESFDGNDIGERIYYNYEGLAVLAIGYQENVIKYYRVLENDKLSAPINYVNNTKTQIVSKYSNGKIALSCTIDKGLFDESFLLLEKNGNQSFKINYKKSVFDSIEVNHPNGKTYYINQYKNGVLSGSRLYLDAQGNKLVEQKFENGYLHGTSTWYSNSSSIKKVTYDSGVITKVSK